MDWIKGMNDAIIYVEDNLTSEINFDAVSRVACSSSYHFQRMFQMLTNMTITEYIRKRRLTMAVTDLAQNGSKVIDVAYKYGYETPESFTKAFKKFHGVTPSKAKKGEQSFQAVLPMTIQISLKGALPMDYRIEKKQALTLRGVKKEVTTVGGQNYVILPKFWEEFFTMPVSKNMVEHVGPLGVIGACYNNNEERQLFDYMIGVEASDELNGEGIEVLEIPEATWAVFTSIGPLPESIQEVWKRIFQEFFPGTTYEHADLPELEIYYDGDTDSEDYRCEVWIPIIKK